MAPVVFRRREFREGSGGAGQFRGGLGQVIELGGADGTPIALLCNFERVEATRRAAATAAGPARRARCRCAPAGRSGPKGRQTVPARDAIRLELPGGGGFGDPRTRDPQRVAEDVLDGLITAEEARRDYAVVVDAEGRVDAAETERLRRAD